MLVTNIYESLLNVSSIYSRGNIESKTLYASSITCEFLEALSSITSTNVVTFFSTTLLEADTADILTANVSTLNNSFMSSFTIDNFRIFSQFSFISTMFVDFQLLSYDNATCYIQKIIGSNNAYIIQPQVYLIIYRQIIYRLQMHSLDSLC